MTDTKDKLMAATLDCLREDGIAGLSARTVAARAGVNQALIFYHFGTLHGLVDAANRQAVAQARASYEQDFAAARSLSDLVTIGRTIREREQANGNVAVMAQLMAGGQRSPELAESARHAVDAWIGQVEEVVRRVAGDSVVTLAISTRDLARALCAGFVGLELYEGIDKSAAQETFESVVALISAIEAIDKLGPVGRRAVSASMRASRRRSAP